MSKVVRVLLVEADEHDYAILQTMLAQVQNRVYKLTWVNSPTDAISLMTTELFDVALIDYDLTGTELIRQVPQEDSFFPRILLTSVEDEEADEHALSSGAADYLIKSKLSVKRLERSIRYAIAHHLVLRAHRETEKRKELTFATMAHDLKTPIRAEYRVLTQMLEGYYGGLTDAQHIIVNELVKSNRFKHHIVDNLMTSFSVTSEQDYTMTPNAVNPIIERLISYELQPLIAEKQHEIVLNLAEEMPVFLFDAFEIERVLRNIIQNAIFYTPPKGRIEIATRQLPDNHKVCIEVTDNGPGIPEERRATVFEPFHSSSKRFKHIGTGLGLYLSKQIVQNHDGQIFCLPADPSGACFRILLPCCQAHLTTEESPIPVAAQ
ncbi:MAG: ATP-binding protein [Candidatus Melainabacteria bacterium]